MGKAVRHIVSNDDRRHVVYWISTSQGVIRRCSDPDCEVNLTGPVPRQALSEGDQYLDTQGGGNG